MGATPIGGFGCLAIVCQATYTYASLRQAKPTQEAYLFLVIKMEKEKYDKLKSKFKLPGFADIDAEFEVSVAEEGNFPLRDARRKMIEKIETYVTLLGEILQPSAESIINMRECRIFNDDEKKSVYEIYKRLTRLKRQSLEADLLADDKNDAEVIKEIFSQWGKLKKDLLTIISKARECWEKETTKKERLEYLG